MDKKKLQESLNALINTLGSIEIHGRDNMQRLLGCIQYMENMLTEINKEGE